MAMSCLDMAIFGLNSVRLIAEVFENCLQIYLKNGNVEATFFKNIIFSEQKKEVSSDSFEMFRLSKK